MDKINNRVMVIAGSHQQYKDFLHEHKLSPSQFPYVSRREQLMGQRGAYYIKAGEYWLNEVWDKGQDLFKVYDMKEVENVTTR